ncbi:hypothetical protein E2C01_073929 [Portunus trituberculatus]|uniref:Uncharacterized protein n=2 Tax=Portunus trituberculatus TaxID=210409 RepID=A0A5B7IAT3_PORTR|nr:hypothetical protein [Portunus trituberculatus]
MGEATRKAALDQPLAIQAVQKDWGPIVRYKPAVSLNSR